MSRRVCINHPDSFCYVCGKFTPKDQRNKLTKQLKNAYKLYFGCKVGDQDKLWAPHVCCKNCYIALTQWLNGKRKSMPFAVPMIWREPTNHYTDCYFCLTNIAGFSKKNKSKIVYPDCPSAIKPVTHAAEGIPIPEPPSSFSDDRSREACTASTSSEDMLSDADEPGPSRKVPHLLSQLELNDLVRDLGLTKEKSELLGSRLKEWNLLQHGVKCSYFRKRHEDLQDFFMEKEGICFCCNVDGLLQEMEYDHVPDEWRLFIDSSKTSLKAVLLHNGNEKPSIPLAHAVGLKETYQSMDKILCLIKYSEYKWNICGDLKVIGLLLGLQTGYTKHQCFLCLWNSRDDEHHYDQKVWPKRSDFTPGRYNVKYIPLVNPQKIYLPPLHIKLGLFKNFVKAMNQNGEGFKYLSELFAKTKSEAKIKAGIFNGPEICKVICDGNFQEKLSPVEKTAWEKFVLLVNKFLGNEKSSNYATIVTDFLNAYKQLGARMSLKIHFLHSHLDFFPPNMGDVSDKHGERFHQEIKELESRYSGKLTPNMMTDYCWFLKRETDMQHKRKKRRQNYF